MTSGTSIVLKNFQHPALSWCVWILNNSPLPYFTLGNRLLSLNVLWCCVFHLIFQALQSITSSCSQLPVSYYKMVRYSHQSSNKRQKLMHLTYVMFLMWQYSLWNRSSITVIFLLLLKMINRKIKLGDGIYIRSPGLCFREVHSAEEFTSAYYVLWRYSSLICPHSAFCFYFIGGDTNRLINSRFYQRNSHPVIEW